MILPPMDGGPGRFCYAEPGHMVRVGNMLQSPLAMKAAERRTLPDKAEHWLTGATEMRAFAQLATNGERRDGLLKIAAEYEMLAERAAEREVRYG